MYTAGKIVNFSYGFKMAKRLYCSRKEQESAIQNFINNLSDDEFDSNDEYADTSDGK